LTMRDWQHCQRSSIATSGAFFAGRFARRPYIRRMAEQRAYDLSELRRNELSVVRGCNALMMSFCAWAHVVTEGSSPGEECRDGVSREPPPVARNGRRVPARKSKKPRRSLCLDRSEWHACSMAETFRSSRHDHSHRGVRAEPTHTHSRSATTNDMCPARPRQRGFSNTRF
jgi:hypothetical protein